MHRYELLPENLREEMKKYLETGLLPTNPQLKSHLGCGPHVTLDDNTDLTKLKTFLHNDLPKESWGTLEKCMNWSIRKGLQNQPNEWHRRR